MWCFLSWIIFIFFFFKRWWCLWGWLWGVLRWDCLCLCIWGWLWGSSVSFRVECHANVALCGLASGIVGGVVVVVLDFILTKCQLGQ